jgi:hypothetical protein
MRRGSFPLYSPRVQAGVFVERRKTARYPIDLLIDLSWNDAFHQARMRDVSSDGLSVVLSDVAAIEAGDALTFGLTLQHVNTDEPARLEGSATVVRVESRDGDLLVAFRAEWLSTFPAAGALGAAGSFSL